MPAAHSRTRRSPGFAHVLEHCHALSRMTRGASPPARARLETALGPQLASRLVGALARGGRGVSSSNG